MFKVLSALLSSQTLAHYDIVGGVVAVESRLWPRFLTRLVFCRVNHINYFAFKITQENVCFLCLVNLLIT